MHNKYPFPLEMTKSNLVNKLRENYILLKGLISKKKQKKNRKSEEFRKLDFSELFD